MNVERMRAAAADVGDFLGGALDMLGAEHEPGLTPARAAIASETADCYLQLAGEALSRFEEATRGA